MLTKMLPVNDIFYKTLKCLDGNLSKERTTVLEAATMIGTNRKLLIIGKSKNLSAVELTDSQGLLRSVFHLAFPSALHLTFSIQNRSLIIMCVPFI